MSRRRQSKGKSARASRGPDRAPRSTSAKDQSQRKRLLGRSWSSLAKGLVGIMGAVIITCSPIWAPAAVRAVKESFSSNSGPAVIVSAEPTFLDDEGYTMATPVGSRPGPQLVHLISQPDGAASASFLPDVRAIGGVNVNVLSIRLIVTGNSSDGVRVIDVRPVSLHRSAPLGGTLFLIPPQAGNATIKMMFDLDEVNPIARDIAHPACHPVTQGDIVFCAPLKRSPYPQEVFDGTVGGELDPGSPFFDNETIHLAGGEQQVLYIRAQVAHFYATFDLEIDYIVGSSGEDVHKVIVTDHGQPFQVTAMPPGAKPDTVSYQEAFNNIGNLSLCPVADPSLVPMGVNAQIRCRS